MKHKWVEAELWSRKAYKCSRCQLHIIDYSLPPAVEVDGKLIMQVSGFALGLKPGKKLPAGVQERELPPGKPVRYQVSNVLNVDFTGKTKKQIITYAEDPPNRECVGVREPLHSAKWRDV